MDGPVWCFVCTFLGAVAGELGSQSTELKPHFACRSVREFGELLKFGSNSEIHPLISFLRRFVTLASRFAPTCIIVLSCVKDREDHISQRSRGVVRLPNDPKARTFGTFLHICG